MTKKIGKKKWTAGILLLLTLVFAAGCGSRSKESLENEKAYRQVGINKMAEGDYEGAVEAFQKALDQSLAIIDELEIDICYYKAVAQNKSGDIKGALETYKALIGYDKKNPDAYYLRGCLYLQQGENEKAQKDFDKAIEYEEKDGRLYNSIASNLKTAGLTDEADKILKKAVELKGDKPGDYREKGYAYFLLGDYDSARQYLDKAINKEDSQAILYLAQVHEAQGNTKQAQQLYETYVSKNAEDTETLNALGCSKMKEGDYKQALTFFQTALAVEQPSNERELRKNEIAALEYLHDFDAAKEKMSAYLEDYPDDEDAVRENEFLMTR